VFLSQVCDSSLSAYKISFVSFQRSPTTAIHCGCIVPIARHTCTAAARFCLFSCSVIVVVVLFFSSLQMRYYLLLKECFLAIWVVVAYFAAIDDLICAPAIFISSISLQWSTFKDIEIRFRILTIKQNSTSLSLSSALSLLFCAFGFVQRVSNLTATHIHTFSLVESSGSSNGGGKIWNCEHF